MLLQRRPRTNLAVATTATAAMALTGCASDDGASPAPSTPTSDAPAASPTETVVDDPTPPVEPSPTSAPSPEPTETSAGIALDADCTLDASDTPVDAITLTFPQDWDHSQACDAFDPEEVVEGTDTVAVTAEVETRSYAEVASNTAEEGVEVRHLAVVDGHQAVRDVVDTELGPMIVWRVDLDHGQDDEPGTLFVYVRNRGMVVPGIADQMVMHAEFERPGDPPADGSTIVGRVEGGGMPWTAVLTADDCAQLYGSFVAAEPASESCLDDSDVADDDLATTMVQFNDRSTYAVGLAGDSVTAVRLGDGTIHRMVPTDDDRRGIAFPASTGDQVELLAWDGSVIATTTVG